MATDSTTNSFMRILPKLLCAAALLALSACASNAPPRSGTSFLESWKDPDAQPLQLRGAKVVAVVMMQDPKARHRAEDALAKEITALGAQGVPMYSISPAGVAPKDGESQTRAIVEAAGAKGVVVMRPVDVNHRTVGTATLSSNSTYGGYWGGYYGIGWNDPWTDFNPDTQTDLVVTIEIIRVLAATEQTGLDRHQPNDQSARRRKVRSHARDRDRQGTEAAGPGRPIVGGKISPAGPGPSSKTPCHPARRRRRRRRAAC